MKIQNLRNQCTDTPVTRTETLLLGNNLNCG
jgi:hypothetical protein